MPSDSGEIDRCQVRVVSIYSTSLRYKGAAPEDLSAKLELGGLTRHYELYKDQLPRLLPFDFLGGPIGSGDIAIAEAVDGIEVTETDAVLFALPSDQVVLAVTLGFATAPLSDPAGLRSVTRVLEQSIEAAVTIRGRSLTDWVAALPASRPSEDGLSMDAMSDQAEPLLPERHQLVFVARGHDGEAVPTPAVINELLYRDVPPYREEFGSPKAPEPLNLVELSGQETVLRPSGSPLLPPDEASNQRLITLGVVTPYVSLLYSHQSYVEDSIFLSTVHAVGTASRFRQIWHEAYQQVRVFREKKQRQATGLQTRADLEELADHLGNLEFDLTFSVEFPLMRIETFHTALYEAMDLSNQAKALSQMFDQLDGSLRSEITAIDVRERRRDDGRQKWNAFAAGVLSLIGVSVGFVIAFLGVNTREVPGGTNQLSMWDSHFAYLYLIAGLFALTPVYLIFFPYLRDWAIPRGQRWLPLGFGIAATGLGAAAFAMTLVEDHHAVRGRAIVLDAIAQSVALFALLIGLSLVGLWARARATAARAAREAAEARAGENRAGDAGPAATSRVPARGTTAGGRRLPGSG
jgi:hypothetical protein